MKTVRYIIVVFALLVSVSTLKAQETFLLKNLYIPQALDENPGTYTPYKFHVGFPALSRIQVGVNMPTNLYNYYHITAKGWKRNTKGNNIIDLNFKEELINFGFRFGGSNYLWFNTSLNVDAGLNIKGGLFDFVINGNADREGKTQQFLDRSAVNGNAYLEFAIGYNREINSQLSVGGKVKYLFGLAHVHTQKAYAALTSQADFDQLLLNYYADVYYGGIVPMDTVDDFGNMSFRQMYEAMAFRSQGLAFDLGFRYRINKWVEVEASVLDLGFIHWDNAKSMRIEPTEVVFEGADLTTAEKREDWTHVFEVMADTMKESVKNANPVDIPSYNKMLTTKLNIGAYVWLSKNDRFGFTFNARMYGGLFVPAGSISYHRNLGKYFDFTVGNTFRLKSALNPGLGFSLKLGAFNLYTMVDYVNNVYVDKLKNVNVVFGINFVGGRFNHIRGKRISDTAPSYYLNF
ncbi:MAG: hypothetical protein J5606_04890 [Bacteroidales bacterium]|nr:hypothetical protein [Bacteroidales bacterium]